MGMLARLSLKEACVVSKPGSSTSTSSSTIKSKECSEAKLKRAATYDEDDFEQNSNPQPTKDLVLLRPAPKGLGNARCPARYSLEYVAQAVFILLPFKRRMFIVLSAISVYAWDLFLFTADSSRNLISLPPSCPRLHNIAMNFPEYAAATVFIDGVKSVEMEGG
ncbi:hypothetical protein BU17DRAFT_68047 [Hysterangium stoloniferum]|nr:hypothetical protein BU17DRAFT_68047 [Hysterangium stoloniferum]